MLNQNYELVLLDVMLPEMDCFSVCSEIRKKSSVPIIMITARSDEYDKLNGYEVGDDDYVTKPFSPKVLLAKANAIFHTQHGGRIGVTVSGDDKEAVFEIENAGKNISDEDIEFIWDKFYKSDKSRRRSGKY